MDIETPALGRIVRSFAIAQTIAILFPLILTLFGVDLGSGTNIGGSFVAALFAAHTFVKTYGRVPTAEERSRLVWLSLAAAWGISLVFVGLYIAIGGQAALEVLKPAWVVLPTAALILIVVVISAIYVGVFHLAYGPMARSFEKKLAVKR